MSKLRSKKLIIIIVGILLIVLAATSVAVAIEKNKVLDKDCRSLSSLSFHSQLMSDASKVAFKSTDYPALITRSDDLLTNLKSKQSSLLSSIGVAVGKSSFKKLLNSSSQSQIDDIVNKNKEQIEAFDEYAKLVDITSFHYPSINFQDLTKEIYAVKGKREIVLRCIENQKNVKTINRIFGF